MRDTKTIILIILTVIVSIIGIIAIATHKPDLPLDNIIIYYGDTCPHCKELEAWMAKNSIKDKFLITEKEVFNNKDNQNELISKASECKLAQDTIGVPFMYYQGACYVGTDAIVKFFTMNLNPAAQSSESTPSSGPTKQ